MKYSAFRLIRLLLSLVGSFIGVLFLAILTGTIGHLLSIGITVLGALGIAKFLGMNVVLSYNIIFIVIAVCGILRGFLRYIEQYFNHFIAFKLLAIIRDKIFTVLRRLCPAKLETKQKGDIIAMITSDIETLEVFYAHTMSPVGICLLVNIVMIAFVTIVSSFYIGIYFAICYTLVAVVLPRITGKKAMKSGKESRDYSSKFSANYLDQIKGSKELVFYNKTSEAIASVTDSTKKLTSLNEAVRKKSLASNLILTAVISLLDAGVVVLGMYLGFSAPVMIVVTIALLSSFGPTIAVGALSSDLNQTFASASRVLDIMQEKPETVEVTGGEKFEFKNLEIKNLSFGYIKEHQVLDNVSLSIDKGEIVGLIGQSGKGKSTILKLLLNFYKVDENKIFYNGIPIENINSNSLKDNVVMVSQSTFLFNKSIRDNLLIANPSASEQDLVEACKCASIYDFIDELPNKFDTVFGKDQEFSFGEKQRLGLARAFLSDANLILLDEPTSNVDVINEGIILKAIKENKYNKTMFIVSHRETVIDACSRCIKV